MDGDMNGDSTNDPLLAFLTRLSSASNEELDDILAPCICLEKNLRHLYANDPQHRDVQSPHAGLISLFDIQDHSVIMRARPSVHVQEETRRQQFIFPLPVNERLSSGSQVAVQLPEFLENWTIFSEQSLSGVNWRNIVVAGGAVLACVSPVPEEHKASRRALRDFFHRERYPTSDIDIFLWGLSPAQVSDRLASR